MNFIVVQFSSLQSPLYMVPDLNQTIVAFAGIVGKFFLSFFLCLFFQSLSLCFFSSFYYFLTFFLSLLNMYVNLRNEFELEWMNKCWAINSHSTATICDLIYTI
jgi:hypothetical protein